MGWLWSSGSNSTDNLDKSLQDFLKKEAPTGPKPALPITPKEPPAQTPPPPATTATTTSHTQTEPEKPSIPPQSQFQDGRYAHLWKGYTPQDVLLDRSKSEQDRLRDLVDSYNDRRSGIGRVAMENCALEYMEQFDCFRNPKTWWSRGTMCQAESRKFNRCQDLQSKFLKALGYLTLDARSQEEDEKIQMHADKLYQQLMAHEAEIEKAKKEGRPEPHFDSLMAEIEKSRSLLRASMQPNVAGKNTKSNPEEDGDVWSRLKPEIKKEYEKKLSELPPDERDIERMAVLGELKAQTGISKKVEQTFIEERIARMKRREEGKQTIGDTIKYWWGWG